MAKKESLLSGTLSWKPGDIPSPSGGKSAALDFSDALMRGNPKAHELLAGAGILMDDVDIVEARTKYRPEEEPSMADRFIASTYTYAKALGMTAHQAKAIEPYMAAYRDDMRRAHRFVLDNAFCRYVTEVSSSCRPEKLLYRLQFANLPYEITWIEFDLKVKVHTMRRFHGLDPDIPDIGDRLGLLLHRMSDTVACCQIVCEMHEIRNQLTPTLICYFFSLDEHTFTRTDGRMSGCLPFIFEGDESPWMNQTDVTRGATALSIAKGSPWGYALQDGKSTMLQSVDDLKGLGVPAFLLRHGETGFSRMWHALADAIPRDNARSKSFANVMVSEATEFAGMMRWVVCLLAMLNEVPVEVHHVRPQGKMRVGLTTKRPLFDYHRLTLRLPKTKPIQWIERRLSNIERRHKAHKVRQFWRTYLNEVRCRVDEHDWVYDYDEGYRLCGKCMAYGRLIHEHVRGNPELGWVHKDYVLKPKDQN